MELTNDKISIEEVRNMSDVPILFVQLVVILIITFIFNIDR